MVLDPNTEQSPDSEDALRRKLVTARTTEHRKVKGKGMDDLKKVPNKMLTDKMLFVPLYLLCP